MTDRTLYTGIRPAKAQAPRPQRNRRVEQMGGTHGGESRAKIDTVLTRLHALGLILAEHDPDKLRAWRLSQMEQLERLKEWRESPDTFGGFKKPK